MRKILQERDRDIDHIKVPDPFVDLIFILQR